MTEETKQAYVPCLYLLESVLWQACGEGEWKEGKGGRVCNSGLKAYEEAMEYLSKADRIRDYNGICGWLVE